MPPKVHDLIIIDHLKMCSAIIKIILEIMGTILNIAKSEFSFIKISLFTHIWMYVP